MEEVTDFAFREMFARYSKTEARDKRQEASLNPFVMFTEFINVDGLLHPEGRKKLEIDLKYSPAQRPIVAQIWGNNPEKFRRAAALVADLGFDGVDINMGCPQQKEIGIGACAALIRNPSLAKEIIFATKEGAKHLPVSVKTRLGYSKLDEMENWVTALLGTDIAALTLHARTKQEMSKVPAHWDKIKEAVEIRDKIQATRDKFDRTLIIGNGDVKSRTEGLARIKETGCDGVMIARGAFGNPWLFSEEEPALKTKLRVMLEHAELFNKTLGAHKPFVIMRKHFKAYAGGFPGCHELRAKLMESKNLAEARQIVQDFFNP